MPYKHQPLDKTLVTQIEVVLADINIRNRYMKEAVAAKLGTAFRSGDADVTASRPVFDAGQAKSACVIHGYGSFYIRITMSDAAAGTQHSVTVPCSGLFVHYGELDKVEVLRADADQRFQFALA